MSTLTATLPDASGLMQIGTSVQSGIQTLTTLLQALQGGDVSAPGSPLASLGGALGGLRQRVTVDVGVLSVGLPQGLERMGHALAPSALDHIRSVERDFEQARGVLADNAVVRAVADGQSLQQVALAAVQAALDSFDQQRLQLLGRLLPAPELAQVTEWLDTLEQFSRDPAAHAHELLPLLSRYLAGQGPELLEPVVSQVRQALALADAWGAEAVKATIEAPQTAWSRALHELTLEIDRFDPQDTASYARLDVLIEAAQTALPPLARAVLTVQAQARTAVQSPRWDELCATCTRLLGAIPLDEVPVPADAVGMLTAVLEQLLARLEAQLTPEDLAVKVRALSAALHEVFEQSPLTQVRQVIRTFLQRLVEAIGAIPAERIGDTVRQVLGTVREQVEALELDQAGQRIEDGFVAVEDFVRETLDQALGEQVTQALQSLLAQLEALPVSTLVDNVSQLIAQLQQAMQQVQSALEGAIAQLTALVAQLDQLSFKPVGDAVVGEIEALRQKVAALNPDALSDIERVALQAALAVVRAADLQGVVQNEVKAGFASARDAALDGLERVTGVLDGVRDRVRQFSPEVLVQQLVDILQQGQQTLSRLDGAALMKPLNAEVDDLTRLLSQARPGRLLGPLQSPYQSVMEGVGQMNPDRLVQPLNALYGRIDALIDKVDVAPVLEELDRRQQALITDLREAIVGGLDGLHLPPPLDAFFAQVRPVLQGMTEALLADPGAGLPDLGLDFSTRLKPSDLFQPLDDAHARLIDLLRGVPATELETVFETLRTGLGLGLTLIDPAQVVAGLRQGRGALASVSPRVLLAGAIRLPDLQARFEWRATGAGVGVQVQEVATRHLLADLVALAQADGGEVRACLAGHEALDRALAGRLAALDASSAQAAYLRVAANLRRLLPGFLFSPEPLTRADILVGLRAARPSAQAAALDELFNRFQQRVRQMQAVLEPAFGAFFSTLREPLAMISPLGIRDDVTAVYTALHDKVRVIDPAVLAADLHAAIYDPVVSALQAIDPARLATRLDLAFDRALAVLHDRVRALLGQVAAALDTQLQRLREAVAAIVTRIQQALQQAAEVFDGLLDGIEHLVFEEVLERLKRLVRTLGTSFDQEIDRVVSAFNRMLDAIPLGGSTATDASIGAST